MRSTPTTRRRCVAEERVPTPRRRRRRCSTPWPTVVRTLAARARDRRRRRRRRRPGRPRAASCASGPTCPGVRRRAASATSSTAASALPVRVDNDATCAAWGEHERRRGARARPTSLLVTLGTGIGGGIVADGRAAAGRQRVRRRDRATWSSTRTGRRARAAGAGCWERFASGSGLGPLGREAADAGRAAAVRRAGRRRPRGRAGRARHRAPPPRATPTRSAIVDALRLVGGARHRQPASTCSTRRSS